MNNKDYAEVKDSPYIDHPTEKTILKQQDELKTLRTQYQVQNETQIGKNQKITKTNNELVVKINLRRNNHLSNNQNLKQQIISSAKKIFDLNL